METNRLIIVANRLPVDIKENNGDFVMTQSSGGLVSSMVSYLEKSTGSAVNNKALWVGAADISEKKFKAIRSDESVGGNNFELCPVFLPTQLKGKFYQGFCNDCIWPLFHYFPSYAKFNAEFYEAYVTANDYFFKKVMEVYRPGDIIWIHDYHLMSLPRMLRTALPEATIGFFLHIPFPSFEVFRIMPNDWKVELLNGLLGADLVGFHTSDYMQYFLKSVEHTLQYEVSGRKIQTPDRMVAADAVPVSIDFNKFYTAPNSSEVYEEKNTIRKKMNGKQIVVSVDRLDYSKALINRLESFELFLQTYPQYAGRVTYMMLVVPSREIITKYKENKMEIERLVGNINGKYGSIDWIPILYQYKSLDFSSLTALYFSADVALITPLRDGMNLVAKEFVSTRVDKRGVLVLSETAGASAELKEALIVNPTDRKEIAETIFKALAMPVEEQMQRNEAMQHRIRNYDVVKWAEDFIMQLGIQKTLQQVLKIKEITPAIENAIVEDYQKAGRRLILLDYDGTLTPFARFPELAVPSDKLLQLLDDLCADTANDVVIISGRKMDILDAWFGSLPVNLVAEHGGYYKKTGHDWKQNSRINVQWKEKILPVMQFHQTRCAGSFIEEKSLSVAWHYRNTDREFGQIRSREVVNDLGELSASLDFQVIEGNMVIEARTNGINKGMAAQMWLNNNSYDFALAIGDDKTDEDMFIVMPENGYSIKVGLMQSHASYNLKKQAAVIDLLNRFTQELKTI